MVNFIVIFKNVSMWPRLDYREMQVEKVNVNEFHNIIKFYLFSTSL